MALTTFGLTPDNITSGQSTAGSEENFSAGPAADRYSIFGTKTYAYPESDTVDGYAVPMMRFSFFDAFGNKVSSAPTLKIRVPQNFNITNMSEYSRTDNIFGAEDGGRNFISSLYTEAGVQKISSQEGQLSAESITSSGTEGLLSLGATTSEAFLYALQKSAATAGGFLNSGGLNGLAQAEFLGRFAVNPYAQLLYKGPQFRRYSIPVNIRPRTETEGKNALNIIKAFKVASSPSVKNRKFGLGNRTFTLQSFTFGYPHLTAFDINFNSPTESKIIFESKLCAIESVAVDYGGQKMAFFEDGIPTEITLTLQLTEVVVRTLGDAKYDSNSTKTIV